MSDHSPQAADNEDAVDALRAAGPVGQAVVRTTRLHKSLAAHLLRPLGLHLSQELVLMRLWDRGPQRQADLVQALESDAATMTRTIRRLESAGLVRRSSTPMDGRVTIITATRESRKIRARVLEAWQSIERAVIADLTEDEQRQAVVLLEKIQSGLQGALDHGID